MPASTLTAQQTAVVTLPADAKAFLEGPAGAGKTTAGAQRLLHLLKQGAPGGSILVLAPQRTLAAAYSQALRKSRLRAGGLPAILTAGGLAQRMVELFWPLVAAPAGFAEPDRPPTFLTLETAQYHMARLVRPLLEQGYFESVTIDRNRLYSQIIDNLNKAAVVGFASSEIGQRLQTAWTGEPSQARVYADVQACATLFRQHCLAHNLLDFSLQVETFWRHVWPLPACREHLTSSYRHLIADNVEEDTPFAHDLLASWLPQLDSALLIYDQDAGYRQFLGADPQSAYELRHLCQEHIVLGESLVTPPALQALGVHLAEALEQPAPHLPSRSPSAAVERSFVYPDGLRYYPQMLDWVVEQIAGLVEEDVSPGEIVILAPFLSDALRFSLMNRLARAGVPARSHRPSRALRDEPATHTLLTLAALAHPQWGVKPSRSDLIHALLQAIAELDLVRGQLLAQIVYRSKDGAAQLSSWEQIKPDMHERISYVLGGRYNTLRVWLADYLQSSDPSAPLDHFLSRLFGEVLSQRGHGFHDDFDAANVAANLVESVQKFRQGMGADQWPRSPTDAQRRGEPARRPQAGQGDSRGAGRVQQRASTSPTEHGAAAPASHGKPLGQEYLEMVEDGVIAAQYVRAWQETDADTDAVLLAPAYTFLMMNRPVDYQFWLDVGSRGWFERLYQPLTHPYVLSRHWEGARPWSDLDEHAANQQRLFRLALGLIRRCRKQIYLGLSELGEQGYEQRGALLWAINQVLQRLASERGTPANEDLPMEQELAQAAPSSLSLPELASAS